MLRGSTSTSVCTNNDQLQSYSRAWQKIITGHGKFIVQQLHLIFKILYHLTKTQTIGKVAYKLYLTS